MPALPPSIAFDPAPLPRQRSADRPGARGARHARDLIRLLGGAALITGVAAVHAPCPWVGAGSAISDWLDPAVLAGPQTASAQEDVQAQPGAPAVAPDGHLQGPSTDLGRGFIPVESWVPVALGAFLALAAAVWLLFRAVPRSSRRTRTGPAPNHGAGGQPKHDRAAGG